MHSSKKALDSSASAIVSIAVIIAIVCAGCSSKPTDATTGDAGNAAPSTPSANVPSASPALSSTSNTASPATDTRHRFKRRDSFDRERLLPAGKVLVACSDACIAKLDGGTRREPRIVLVDRAKSTPATFPFPTTKEMSATTYAATFDGTYPDGFYATLGAIGDDTGFTQQLRWNGKAWEPAQIPTSAIEGLAPTPVPARENREALLRAPYRRGTSFVLHGSGGPLTMIPRSGDSYATYLEGRWVQAKAPWQPGNEVSAVRLASGASLVGGAQGAFVVDVRGSAASIAILDPVDRVDPAPLANAHVIVVDDTAWLLGGSPAATRVLALPVDAGAFAVAKPTPESKATTMSSGTTSSGTTSTATPISLPEVGPKDDACKTPFVVLGAASTAQAEASPDQAPYHDLRRALVGLGALQDEALFVEIPQAGGRVFGVQLQTAAGVAAVLKAIALRLPATHPTVGCLDVRAAISDLDAPPPGVQVFFVNLTTGDVVR